MNLLLLLGSHPRHLYLYKLLKKKFNIRAIIMQRENNMPIIKKKLKKIDLKNFKNHFTERQNKEIENFGDLKVAQFLKNKDFFVTNQRGLNTLTTKKIISQFKPSKCIIFGTNLIKSPLLDCLPNFTLNLHLGLSPYYRGSATLFWPFYFIQPLYAGVTIHKITKKVDAGDILHQVTIKAKPNDGIHDISCKLIKKTFKDIVKILNSKKKKIKFYKQEKYGKVFLKKDFLPEHLRLVYNIFDNKYKNFYKIKQNLKKPKIISFFR
jgi:methionyl-tRNA formyltransferase